MRKNYLDNIRSGTVILVLVYHVFFIFNTVGIAGSIGGGIYAFDVISTLIYPWFMVLLFLVAGISARYSLQKRTHKQFAAERVCKLLVLSACCLLYNYLDLPMVLVYFFALVIELALVAPVYEIFKRIPVVRYMVLGERKKHRI